MSDDNEQTFRGRVTRQGEETIGRLAQELMENSVVSGALSAAFQTRERALRAQEAAMAALNLPSAGDLERLTRRVRSVSQRLEGIEEGLDRLDERLAQHASAPTAAQLDERLARIEAALERLEAERAATPPRPPATRSRAAKPAAKAPAAKRAPRTRRPPAAS